ncbi:MAG TPA: hypothetical protein VGC82_04670 [Rhodopila sp.]
MVFLAVLIAANLMCKPSWALFDNYGLDAAYCQQPTVRSTVVYIDDMMMAEGQTEWATKLAVKLRATLTPGERVSVVRLSPASGQSKEYWSGCWPDYPAAKKAALANETYILQQNPVDKIADQKKYFVRDFGAALTRIYLDSKRPPDAVRIAADSPPQKQLLRALASDEGRFANSATTIRRSSIPTWLKTAIWGRCSSLPRWILRLMGRSWVPTFATASSTTTAWARMSAGSPPIWNERERSGAARYDRWPQR